MHGRCHAEQMRKELRTFWQEAQDQTGQKTDTKSPPSKMDGFAWQGQTNMSTAGGIQGLVGVTVVCHSAHHLLAASVFTV
jgi:hypothetical protein